MTSPCLVGEFEAGLINTSAYLRTDCITLQVLRNKMVIVDGEQDQEVRTLELQSGVHRYMSSSDH